MKFSLDPNPGGHRIQGYEPGRIRIDAAIYQRSLVVMADLLLPDWEPDRIQQLTARHVTELAQHQPELVLVGTGARQVFPEPRLFLSLMDLGIGYEIMDTAAACRTYNILAGEGRRVLGALFV
jgi:uncharacterized protein